MNRPASAPVAVPQEWPATGLASAAELVEMRRRLSAIERVFAVRSSDSELNLAEVAIELRVSPKTLRRWLKSGERVRELRLDRLMTKNAMGRWCSTQRRVNAWREEIAHRWSQILWSTKPRQSRSSRPRFDRTDQRPTVAAVGAVPKGD